MLITALLGREVPSGRLPIDVHALVVNVATAAEIGRLLPRGRGIQERVVTVSGPAVKKKGNYRVPIGTPLRFLLETGRRRRGTLNRVFLGGPMMGQAVSSLDIPITKGTSGVVAFDDDQAEKTHREVFPCIRCGYCLDACPMFLNPSELGLLARNEEYERMADEQPPDGLLRVRLLLLRLSVAHSAGAAVPRRQVDGPQAEGVGVSALRKTLEIRTSPHIVSGYDVDAIMFNVVVALLPTTAFAVYVFGLAAVAVLRHGGRLLRRRRGSGRLRAGGAPARSATGRRRSPACSTA